MNKLIIIICVFLSIFLMKLYSIEKLEHLTNQSDEAIQNIASLYNKDQLTIGALNVTGKATANSFTANSFTDKSMNTTIKAYIDAKASALTRQIYAVSSRATSAQNGVNVIRSQANSLQAQVNQRVVINGRYGFLRGQNNSVIWNHGIKLTPCTGSSNCKG
jgi:hypothetical protein